MGERIVGIIKMGLYKASIYKVNKGEFTWTRIY